MKSLMSNKINFMQMKPISKVSPYIFIINEHLGMHVIDLNIHVSEGE